MRVPLAALVLVALHGAALAQDDGECMEGFTGDDCDEAECPGPYCEEESTIVCDGESCYDSALEDATSETSDPRITRVHAYSDEGYLMCAGSAAVRLPARPKEPTLGLIILDNAFHDGPKNHEQGVEGEFTQADYPQHDYPRLTPQIRATVPRWAERGMLGLASEIVLFIQNLEPGHCDEALALFEKVGAKDKAVVYGHSENVGIPGGMRFLMTKGTASHLLFLERDFLIDKSVKRRVAETILLDAQRMLASRSVELVLLRLLGKSRGYGGVSSVCKDPLGLRIAFRPNQNRQGDFMEGECRASTALNRFFTATAALDFCTEDAFHSDANKGVVEECEGTDPSYKAYCYSSRVAHWTNNPVMARREWLMEHLVPLIPKCALDDDDCKYATGIETNLDLQCPLRELDYRIAQTEGIFRHMNPVWLGREKCEEDAGGYYWPDTKQCRVWS